MKTIHVAAAIIQRVTSNGTVEVLAAQRGYGKLDGLWEFPGGKLESGETPEQACVREVREELDVRIVNLQDFYALEYDYPDFHLVMDCFSCELEPGSVAKKCDNQRDLRWVPLGSLAEFEWMPSDTELVQMLDRAAGSGAGLGGLACDDLTCGVSGSSDSSKG